MGRIEGLLMDMDGLLLDSEEISIRAWQAALAERGRPISREAMLRCLGRSLEFTLNLIQEQTGVIDADGSLRARRIAIGKQMMQPVPPLKPGAMALLDALDELGIPRAVCTSTGEELARWMLERCGILPRLDALFCGSDSLPRKPAPDTYFAGAAALGLPPEACAVAEDSPIGATAGLRAGMTVFLVPDLAPAPEEMLGRVVLCDSLLDVAAHLRAHR